MRSIFKDLRLSAVSADVVHAVHSRLNTPGACSAQAKLAISLIDLTNSMRLQCGNFQGDELFYPASVVKLFFLAAACMALEKGEIERSPKLLSALSEMIKVSSNTATSYVVDVLTGTESGEPLPDAEMVQWSRCRQFLNETFLQRGYTDINICQKTWNDAPYGRDKVFLGQDQGKRNFLSANNTARLMEEIVLGKITGPEYTSFMMELLKRDRGDAGAGHPAGGPTADPDDQATGFCGAALPEGARLWSKAGWTSEVRHDAAYIELADGTRLIMVIFTRGCSEDRKLIPELAAHVLSGLGKK